MNKIDAAFSIIRFHGGLVDNITLTPSQQQIISHCLGDNCDNIRDLSCRVGITQREVVLDLIRIRQKLTKTADKNSK